MIFVLVLQALSSLSTGVFDYPIYESTHVALATVRKWLETDSNAFYVSHFRHPGGQGKPSSPIASGFLAPLVNTLPSLNCFAPYSWYLSSSG